VKVELHACVKSRDKLCRLEPSTGGDSEYDTPAIKPSLRNLWCYTVLGEVSRSKTSLQSRTLRNHLLIDLGRHREAPNGEDSQHDD